jgi:hypothetical protein
MAKGRGGASFNELWFRDLRAGRMFEIEIIHRFRTSVHYPYSSPAGSFFPFVVFLCSSFHLTEESVGMALHSVLGV